MRRYGARSKSLLPIPAVRRRSRRVLTCLLSILTLFFYSLEKSFLIIIIIKTMGEPHLHFALSTAVIT
jgi:hypothetical protein